MARIVVIQGHPDPSGNRLCHALANAYVAGATAASHDIEVIDVASLDFPLLRTQESWHQGADATPEGLKSAQQACIEADHFVLIYPLWARHNAGIAQRFPRTNLPPWRCSELRRRPSIRAVQRQISEGYHYHGNAGICIPLVFLCP